METWSDVTPVCHLSESRREEQGIDWRVENRKNRQELFNEKARLESEITTLNEGWNDLATKLENGEIDELATGGNWDLINAIGAYKSVTGKTEEGYYVKPDKNEKTTHKSQKKSRKHLWKSKNVKKITNLRGEV